MKEWLQLFIGYTAASAIFGIVLLVVGLTTAEGDGTLTGFPAFAVTVGAFLLFLSPLWSGVLLWIRRGRLRSKAEKQKRASARFHERHRLVREVERHRAALQRNLNRSQVKNDYGVVTSDTRRDALLEFFASIELDTHKIEIDDAIEVTLGELELHRQDQLSQHFDPTMIPANGFEFEQWVATSLQKFGWETELTSGGGDQGVDIIAEQYGKRIGLQCKLYSAKVGNKAIQEAYAGKQFYGLHQAAVISNAGYTRSAQELAGMTNTLLLTPDDIPVLSEKVFN